MIRLGKWLVAFLNLGRMEYLLSDLLEEGLDILRISLPFHPNTVDVIFPSFFPKARSLEDGPVKKGHQNRYVLKKFSGKIKQEITLRNNPQGSTYCWVVTILDDKLHDLLNRFLGIDQEQQSDYGNYHRYINKIASIILTADCIKLVSSYLIKGNSDWFTVFSKLDNAEFDLEELLIDALRVTNVDVLSGYKRLRLASQHEIPLTNDPYGKLLLSQECSDSLFSSFPNEGLDRLDLFLQILWESIAAKIFFRYLELGGQDYITYCDWCGAFVCMEYKGKRKYCVGESKSCSSCNALMNAYKTNHPEYNSGSKA